MAGPIPILKLRRSQPEMGKSVMVEFIDENGKSMGALLFSFDQWIKFQKLVQRGQESNAREQYPVQMKIVVEGYVKEKAKPEKPIEVATTATPEQAQEAQEEEDAEEELQKVLAETPGKIPVEEQLVRTLKEGK